MHTKKKTPFPSSWLRVEYFNLQYLSLAFFFRDIIYRLIAIAIAAYLPITLGV
jgi:hypothetical protein